MTTTAAAGAAPRTDGRSTLRAAALSTLVAVVGVTIACTLARASGDDLVVTAPGRSAGRVPAAAALGATLTAGAVSCSPVPTRLPKASTRTSR